MKIDGQTATRTFEANTFDFTIAINNTYIATKSGYGYADFAVTLSREPLVNTKIEIENIRTIILNDDDGRGRSFTEYFKGDSNGRINAVLKIKVISQIPPINYHVTTNTFEWDISYLFPSIDMSEPTYTLDYKLNSKGYFESVTINVNHSLFEDAYLIVTKPNGYELAIWHGYNPSVLDYSWLDKNQYWESGQTYKAELEINLDRVNGTYRYYFDIDFPSYVSGIELEAFPDLTINQTHKIEYNLIKPDGAYNDFDNKTVYFYSSNTNVATVNRTTGVIKAIGEGNAIIRAEAQDNSSGSKPAATQYIYVVAAGGFPKFSANYDRLDKSTVDKLINAENRLKQAISPAEWVDYTFDGYATPVTLIYTLISNIITNCKNLANSYDTSCRNKANALSIQRKNTNAHWQTNINNLVDCIEQMQIDKHLQ